MHGKKVCLIVLIQNKNQGRVETFHGHKNKIMILQSKFSLLVFIITVLCFRKEIMFCQTKTDTLCPNLGVAVEKRLLLFPGINNLIVLTNQEPNNNVAVNISGPAKIEKINCLEYKVTIDSITIGDPEKMENWEGFIECKDELGEIVFQQKYFIQDFPPPIVRLGHLLSGMTVSSKLFASQTELNAFFDYSSTNRCDPCKILGFEITKASKTGQAISFQNISAVFSKDVLTLIKSAKSGD